MSTGSDRPQLPTPVASWRNAVFQTLCASIATVLFVCLYSWWSGITSDSSNAGKTTTPVGQSASSDNSLPLRTSTPLNVAAEITPDSATVTPVVSSPALPPKMSAVILARVTGLLADADEVTQSLDALAKEQKAWSAKRTTLLSDDAGRRIAASETQVALVAPAMSRELPSDKQIIGWTNQLALLTEPLSDARRERPADFTLDGSIESAINDLGQKAKKALDQLRRDRVLVEAILAETKSQAPTAESLQATLESRLVAEAKQQAEEVEQGRKQLLAEKAKQLKALEAEKIAAAASVKEQELAAQTAELNDRSRKLEAANKAEEERRKEEAAKVQLEKEFQRDLPDIKKYLSAFITPGIAHRDGLKGIRGPVSLSFLEREGVFQENRAGMQKMIFLAHSRNDRNPGAIPNALSGDIDWFNVPKEPLMKAQGFLIKYGKLLVEKEMLDP